MEAAATPYPWSQDALCGSFEAGDTIFVLEVGDELAGYAVFRLLREEAELLNIAVGRAMQGKGWGRNLLQLSLDSPELAIAETVFLEVRASNQAAISLYQTLGFARYSQRSAYYPLPDSAERENAVLFRWLRFSLP